MMSSIIKRNEVDLEVYPTKDSHEAHADNQLSIGDLHGNALKLIYFLIQQNVLDINEANYNKLVTLYKKDTDALTKGDLALFNQILNQVKLNAVGTIRLIGDELADRGSNDYFTLKVLERLGRAGVHTEVLLSNHSTEFLEAYQVGNPNYEFDKSKKLHRDDAKSFYNLGLLVEKGLVDQKEINKIVERHYKPNLKAISYTVDDKIDPPSITLYTHAPVGLETIRELAKQYQVDLNEKIESHLSSFCHAIDEINDRIMEQHIKPGISVYTDKVPSRLRYIVEQLVSSLGSIKIPEFFPLIRLIWNRPDKQAPDGTNDGKYAIDLPEYHHHYNIQSAHGHNGPLKGSEDKPESSYQENMINLDNDFGKRSLKGNFHILYSQEKPSPKLSHVLKVYKKYGEKLGDVILSLEEYIEERKQEKTAQKSQFHTFWGRLTGMSADLKISTAENLLNHLVSKNSTAYKFTEDQILAAREGRLRKITEMLEKENLLPEAFIRMERQHVAVEFSRWRSFK